MWNLIKKDFNAKQRVLYLADIILFIYILGVGLGSRFELIIPPATFMASLGTGIYIVTEIMIIFTALTFASHKAKLQINNNHQNSIEQIFWSKIIMLLINYINLVVIAFASALIAQRFIFKDQFLNEDNLHLMAISIGANFMLVFVLCMATSLFSTFVHSARGAIASGLGFQYLGSALAGPFMILLYHHKWLKWNPFNCLFVQYQINKPINHTMTKLSMVDAIISTIVYGLVYLFLAYIAFSKFNNSYLSNKSNQQ